MPETCENWLGRVNSRVYYAHQSLEIYQVRPYWVNFKALILIMGIPLPGNTVFIFQRGPGDFEDLRLPLFGHQGCPRRINSGSQSVFARLVYFIETI